MGTTERTIVADTPLGAIAVSLRAAEILRLRFVGNEELRPAAGDARLADELAAWFRDGRLPAHHRLAPHGTVFQRQVWQAVGAIARGSTRSYGMLAQQLGRPRAVRAVASALAANPVLLLIPCHRVVGHDGGLCGYAGGLERKRALLAIEGADTSSPREWARRAQAGVPEAPGRNAMPEQRWGTAR